MLRTPKGCCVVDVYTQQDQLAVFVMPKGRSLFALAYASVKHFLANTTSCFQTAPTVMAIALRFFLHVHAVFHGSIASILRFCGGPQLISPSIPDVGTATRPIDPLSLEQDTPMTTQAHARNTTSTRAFLYASVCYLVYPTLSVAAPGAI